MKKKKSTKVQCSEIEAPQQPLVTGARNVTLKMANITEDIAMSVPFRFVVGPIKREFWMHRAIVAAQSPVLDRLVNGEFREAKDLHAELESVDEKTFYFFWQYAYGGDYGDIEPIQEPVAEPVTEPEPDLWWGGGLKSLKQNTGAWMNLKTFSNHGNPPEPSVKPPSTVYTRDLFITHARLYVFADCYGISKLAAISFYRLSMSLMNHEPNNNMRVKDVVDLLRYCFDHAPKKLRDLMMLYAACEIKRLIKNDEFCKFFEDHGELSIGLIRAMAAN